MFSLISGCCVCRAAVLRLGLGFVLVWGGAEAQAIEADNDIFAPKLDRPTSQVTNSRGHFLPEQRFTTSVALARPVDTPQVGSPLGTSFERPFSAKPQQESVRPIDAPWRQAYDRNRSSLADLLRLEFNRDPVRITFRPHSVSIKRERFNLELKSNLASMLWSKAF